MSWQTTNPSVRSDPRPPVEHQYRVTEQVDPSGDQRGGGFGAESLVVSRDRLGLSAARSGFPPPVCGVYGFEPNSVSGAAGRLPAAPEGVRPRALLDYALSRWTRLARSASRTFGWRCGLIAGPVPPSAAAAHRNRSLSAPRHEQLRPTLGVRVVLDDRGRAEPPARSARVLSDLIDGLVRPRRVAVTQAMAAACRRHMPAKRPSTAHRSTRAWPSEFGRGRPSTRSRSSHLIDHESSSAPLCRL